MSIKKQYLKSKPVCKVTFRLSADATGSAANAVLMGDFNNWTSGDTPMKRLKNGDFTATVTLAAGREYQFRYLVDGACWLNDPHADKQVFSPYANCDNSVVVV